MGRNCSEHLPDAAAELDVSTFVAAGIAVGECRIVAASYAVEGLRAYASLEARMAAGDFYAEYYSPPSAAGVQRRHCHRGPLLPFVRTGAFPTRAHSMLGLHLAIHHGRQNLLLALRAWLLVVVGRQESHRW